MKKTVLAAATLSVLMASGMASAAYTPADASGNWAASLNFNGTITNKSPLWQYQIPDTAVSAAKDWTVNKSTGTVNGTDTTFSFTKNFQILQGAMVSVSHDLGTGMQPQVVFGDGKDSVKWDTTGPSLDHELVLQVKNGNDAVGHLSMALKGQACNQAIWSGNSFQDSAYDTASDAYQILRAQPYYDKTYTNRDLGRTVHTNNTSALTDTTATDGSAALEASVSNFKLTFPTASIPDTWTATLPISITVK